MRDFLTLGAGGELTWYDTVLEGTVWETNGGWWGDTATTETAEEADTNTAPDAGYQSDKNVLYRITKDGEDLYTNTDWSLANPNSLPEGYSFLLVFKDGKAQAWKDGEELDLYGNGIYTRESPWYLPGYENFTAGEDVAGVEVRMAVREEPIPYLQGQYAGGYVEGDSPMYALYDSLREARQSYLACAVTCIAGLFVLSLAFFWKEDRRRAQAAIAAKTRYVWTELRFLAVVVCLMWLIFGYTDQGRPVWLLFHFLSSIGDLSPGTLVREYLPTGISMVLEDLPLLLILCLVLWLIHVDHRHNPKERRRGWLRSLVRILRDRTLQLPVQRHLRRWALTPAAAMVLGAAAMFLLLVIGVELFWWNVYFAYMLLTILGLSLIHI